ncbi:membrane-associated proteins in eicosanoid and glutathione metabolism [Corynespora cassiicola Philippines]|uniref:Membrane-associated proteins in eicosanoid and glutathione metabolism n=1 Tax=Corynespora cassiicola Philippines TaxID=1448308 RepID=A0A2T2P900_CORCC|nr:membrane-associated proteins in eicosanoid and glutathione metabolism [Corynespora cassiicola Philippines]
MIRYRARDSYVLLAAVSTFVVGSFLGGRVGSFRAAAKIPYPYEYASYEQVRTASPAAAKAMDNFNRAQRAHQNFNENHVSALGAMLIAGLKYPTLAAYAGFGWSVNRVIYGLGYTNGAEGGKGRYYGVLWMVCHYVMVGAAGKAAWEFVKSA